MAESVTPRPSPEEVLADALQNAWNDWCSDTGCIPEGFRIAGPPTTQIYAEFRPGNFLTSVVWWMRTHGYEISEVPR